MVNSFGYALLAMTFKQILQKITAHAGACSDYLNPDAKSPHNHSNYRKKPKTPLCATCAYIPHIEYVGGLVQGMAKRTIV